MSNKHIKMVKIQKKNCVPYTNYCMILVSILSQEIKKIKIKMVGKMRWKSNAKRKTLQMRAQ